MSSAFNNLPLFASRLQLGRVESSKLPCHRRGATRHPRPDGWPYPTPRNVHAMMTLMSKCLSCKYGHADWLMLASYTVVPSTAFSCSFLVGYPGHLAMEARCFPFGCPGGVVSGCHPVPSHTHGSMFLILSSICGMKGVYIPLSSHGLLLTSRDSTHLSYHKQTPAIDLLLPITHLPADLCAPFQLHLTPERTLVDKQGTRPPRYHRDVTSLDLHTHI